MTNYSNTNVCAFTKTSGSEKVIVLTNLRSTSSTFTIPAAMSGSFKEVYTGANINLTSGSTITLNPFQYLVVTNVYYYTIQNRWKGTYLYDSGYDVAYGTTVANNNYRWEKIMVDGRYTQFKNLGTGEFMHIENQTGTVQCGPINTAWASAQWTPEYVDGTWIRIRNRWQPGSIVNVESQSGTAKYSGAQDGFQSAQWRLNPVAGGTSTSKFSNTDVLTEEEQNTVATIVPNPATNNELHILLPELETGDVALITVSGMNGRTVLTEKLSASGEINHHLAAGLYIVNINSKSFNVTEKLIVK